MLDGGTKPWASASSPLQHPGPLCVFPTRCTPQGAAVEAGHLSLQPHLADCSAVGISPELGPQAPPLCCQQAGLARVGAGAPPESLLSPREMVRAVWVSLEGPLPPTGWEVHSPVQPRPCPTRGSSRRQWRRDLTGSPWTHNPSEPQFSHL